MITAHEGKAQYGPPPPQSDPDNLDELVVEVAYYEHLPRLDRAEFDAYVKAEALLETLISSVAAQNQKEFEYQQAHELLDQFAALNARQREIAERERGHAGDDPEFAAVLDYIMGAAAGNVILAEGLQDANRADERRAAGDFEAAEGHLRNAMAGFARLAGSDLPSQPVGALRFTLTEAMLQMVTGLAQMRSGDFRGAYTCFDNTRVVLTELLTEAEGEHARDDGQADPQFEELRVDLSDGLRYIKAVQAFVETLREAQNGNYPDAVASGREAVAAYERIVEEMLARRVSRNARVPCEMELARVRGWLTWARAELAVDKCQWTDCRDLVREARTHWNEANRAAARLVYLGVLAQRPEAGNTDMLLQSTLRRCDRERTFQAEIDTLKSRTDHASRIEIHAQGGTSSMSSPQFNAPVSTNSIGDHNQVDHNTVHADQRPAGPDLKELAAQLAELRAVLATAARTPQERETVTAVAAAEEAAVRNDRSAMSRHLAATGRWALETAQQLVLTAAATAIKAGIGG